MIQKHLVAHSVSPLVDDGRADIADYNKELDALQSPPWFDVPWLYAECYLYRLGYPH